MASNLQPRVGASQSVGGVSVTAPRSMYNPLRGSTGSSMMGGGGFNPLAAGTKTYGLGRTGPNTGMTLDKAGYSAREARNEARLQAYNGRAGY